MRGGMGLSLQQTEFFGAADGRPTIIHPEFGVDVLCLGPDGIERHHALTSDFGTAHFGAEQPEHVELVRAQRLDQSVRAVRGL